jgi:hypothetical protein
LNFETHRYINDVLVRAGAEITNPVSTIPILGRRIEVGAACEAMKPEAWRPIITAQGTRLWEGPSTRDSLDAASAEAREHYNASLDRSLRRLFEA